MAAQEPATIQVTALLDRALLSSRGKLGKEVQALCRQRRHIVEQRAEDGTLRCPLVSIETEEAQPGEHPQQLKAIRWQVAAGRPRVERTVPHILLCFTPQEFVSAADSDGLSSVLQQVEGAHPGWRLHILTYEAGKKRISSTAAAGPGGAGEAAAVAAANGDGMRERLWQLVADVAVWRPDVAFFNASSLQKAAEHVYRLTRAVAEGESGYKKTTVSSYLEALPQSESAQKKRDKLETLLLRYASTHADRSSSAAALMRALLAIEGVRAEAAYAVGLRYGSLQALLAELERDASTVRTEVAGLLLPASTAEVLRVGPSAARSLVAALGVP